MFFYNTGTETPDTWGFLVVGNQPIDREIGLQIKKPRFFGLLWTVADNMTSTFFGHPFNHHQNTLRNQDFGQIVYIHTWILEAFDLWTLIAAALSAHVDKSKKQSCVFFISLVQLRIFKQLSDLQGHHCSARPVISVVQPCHSCAEKRISKTDTNEGNHN